MSDMDSDAAMRLAAFAPIKQLLELRDALTASDLKPGFQFEGARISLINPQRGIFKPTQMKYLLSIKTVFPNPGGRVWYDDQREVHGQHEQPGRRRSIRTGIGCRCGLSGLGRRTKRERFEKLLAKSPPWLTIVNNSETHSHADQADDAH